MTKLEDASTPPTKTYPAPLFSRGEAKTGEEKGPPSPGASSDSTGDDMNSGESTNTLDDWVNVEEASESAATAALNLLFPMAAGSKLETEGGAADYPFANVPTATVTSAEEVGTEKEAAPRAAAVAPSPADPPDAIENNDTDDSDASTYDHDLVFARDHDTSLTATVKMQMASLGLRSVEDFDSEDDNGGGGDRGGSGGDDRSFLDDDDDLSVEHDELDESHDGDEDDDDEAEVRTQVDKELDMNLRRAELRHVEIELKLVAAEEDVRMAKEVLTRSEGMREVYQKQAHMAWEDVGEAETLIGEERVRREEEDAAKYLAERQAQAIIEADDLRQRGNEAYKKGNSGESEALYKLAIDELEMCEIVLEEPSHLTLRTNRAAALMALGRTREALSECEMVLEINPCNIRALSRASNCCIKLGDLSAAKIHVDDMCLSPDATTADLRAATDQHQKIIAASVERDRLVGNDSYRHGDYEGALRWYDAAIAAAKDAKETESLKTVKVGLHTNRAAAHLMMGHPLPAAEDCCAALRLDNTHSKAQVRLARCLLQLGDFSEARQEATDVTARTNAELQSKSEARNVMKDIEAVETALREVGDMLKAAESWRPTQDGEDLDVRATAHEALMAIDAAMLIAPQVPDLITLKAEAFRMMGKAEEALALISGKKTVNARRRFVEVRVQFDLGNVTACVEAGDQLVGLLQMVPTFRAAMEKKRGAEETKEGDEAKHASDKEGGDDDADGDDKIKELAAVPDPEGLLTLLDKASKISRCKEDGRGAFFQGKHQDALGMYTEALIKSAGAPMLEGLFLSNICACEQALGKYADALSSAGTAVAIVPTFVKAHSRLATLYTELDMLTDAVAAYRTMLELPLERSEETQVRSKLATVIARVKNNRPVNWYKLLGVEASAGATDIKKAYRQHALVHHPDKAGRGGVSADVAMARAEMSSKLFKQVGEAHRVLTNATERAKWEGAKARADRQDSYATSGSYTSTRSYASTPSSHAGAGSRYDRYASHWSDLYDDEDEAY